MKSPRSISFSANLYADNHSSPCRGGWEGYPSFISPTRGESSDTLFQSTRIEQFSREKSIWIFPVPSEIVAKQIFPNDRWSMTRPASATSLFGALMISSTVRNSLFAPLAISILEGYFARIFPRELVISNLVAKGFTPSARMRSSFRIRSRVSVE